MAAFLNSARYVGTLHSSAEARLRYVNHFRTKEIIPSYVFRYEAFDKYNIQVQTVISNIGWMNALPAYPQSFCPEPFRLFYANLRVLQVSPLRLQTVVNDNYDLIEHVFNHIAAIQSIAILPLDNPMCISNKCIPDHLRVLHFMITRHFLPRSSARDELSPLDIWALTFLNSSEAFRSSLSVLNLFSERLALRKPPPKVYLTLPTGENHQNTAVKLEKLATNSNYSFIRLISSAAGSLWKRISKKLLLKIRLSDFSKFSANVVTGTLRILKNWIWEPLKLPKKQRRNSWSWLTRKVLWRIALTMKVI
ncbi:hypothetical protein LINPERHAP2_LOCUS37473 [Linum perenne]